MQEVNIFGAGGQALVVRDIIKANNLEMGVFYELEPTIDNIDGDKVVAETKDSVKGPAVIGIGDNQRRERVAQRYSNLEFTTLAHPMASVSPYANIDQGTVIMQGAMVQSHSKIGKHCIINTGASVDHECVIEDFVHISPHATLCGNVRVGRGTWIGAGAVIIPGVSIGNNCVIAAGSVVNHNLQDNAIAAGNPARVIRHKE